MTARDDAIKATVQFARDTDDPVAALAVFRQVLAEAEVAYTMAVYAPGTIDHAGAGRAFRQMMVVGHGLAALVERCMEPWDEDTWPDYLRDLAENDGSDSSGDIPEWLERAREAIGRAYPTPHHETAGDPDDYDDLCLECGANIIGADESHRPGCQLLADERLVAMADCDDDEDADRPPTDQMWLTVTVCEVDDDMVPGSW